MNAMLSKTLKKFYGMSSLRLFANCITGINHDNASHAMVINHIINGMYSNNPIAKQIITFACMYTTIDQKKN